MMVTLETAKELTTMTKLMVTLSLVLTNNSNEHHVYKIPQFIYDPKSPLKIIGVLDLVTFFGDNADVHSPLADDSTTVKYGATKSHFVWDHGQ